MKIITSILAGNDSGSAIIVALLMTAALSLAVFIAMSNSMTNSKMMRNNRDYRDNLYNAETGISVAAEEHRTQWLNPASKLFKPTASFPDPKDAAEGHENITIKDENNQLVTVASYEIARIEKNPLPNSLSAKMYKLAHQAPPPIGSGTSPKSFEIRRYGIRSRAVSKDSLTIESGLYKFFNKLN